MSSALLSQVAGIVASVAGPLVFKPGAVVARGVAAQDDRGGSAYSQVVAEVQLLKSNKRKGNEGDLPAGAQKSAKFLILAQGVPNIVRPGAFIAFNSAAYNIISIKRDPANAILECACEKVGRYQGAGKDIELILEA